MSFTYESTERPIFENFSLRIQGPERIALSGPNGSGKTTLVKLLLGELKPINGKISLGTDRISYLDQHASLLDPHLSVLENFRTFNPSINETTARLYLAQFLFRNIDALKIAKDLSGGEKIRALLACVLMAEHPPQLLILDEPTNHLDLSSIECIESALQKYQGAMIVISHDKDFLKNISVMRTIDFSLLHS